MDFSVAVLFTYYSRFKQTDWVSLYPKKKRLASLSVILLTFLFNCASIRFYRHHTTIVQQNVTCLYRGLSDCKTKHSWLTYDLRLLLRNFAPVLVWNVYGDCLTDCVRLMAFAAKLCTSYSVKLLRWLPDWLPTTYAAFAAKLCTSLLRWLSDDVALWLLGYRKKWVSKIKLRMTSSY